MSHMTTGFIMIIIAATSWDMGMRALPIVVAVMGVLFIWASLKH